MEEILERAARLLGDDSLTLETGLRTEGRNRVARAVRPDGTSVIVKATVTEDGSAFDSSDDSSESPAWRLRNEGAGLAFLTALGVEPPFSPRFLAGDMDSVVVAMEDLGEGRGSLADRLTGDEFEAAESALLAYADGLGRMHAATAGREEAYDAQRLRWGGSAGRGEMLGGDLDADSKFLAILERFGVEATGALAGELSELLAVLASPRWRAFTPSDCCPDNHLLSRDGRVMFFDLEFAGFRHALLDAAYLTVPFSTCWCMGRLPEDLIGRALAAYRAAFDPDPRGFERGLAAATGYWMTRTIAWNWHNWEEEDHTWGLATIRQRHLLRLENGAKYLGPHFPALAETAAKLHDALASRWPELEPMPLYKPFRSRKPGANGE